MNTQAITQHFDSFFCKIAKKIGNKSSMQVLVNSEKLGINYCNFPGESENPFHIASIGKVFTAVLLFRLIERGKISLNDLIINYLTTDQCRDLFSFKGVDYSGQVTIRDLVAHTSGAADYFEDPVIKGIPFLKHRDTLWTPETLLDFTREKQKSVSKPGTGFHYSDTGYILLGKIIEKVTEKPFHENLHFELFVPLEMNDSYLMFYSEPANQPKKAIQKIWVNDIEISTYKSLSCDWAGGGIISTLADLLKFQKALRKGCIISIETLSLMENCSNRFRTGIYYGLGMMEIHFEEFFFLLKGLPRVTGHIGILATHLFYDKKTDTHIVMNFGSNSQMTTSFKVLIDIMNTIGE
jgi:D-alanyl-D-alanine carboxypeptidase